MKISFIFYLLFVISFADKMKNIGYLQMGYDVLKGNPLSTAGIDPGFRNSEIFQFDYTTSKLTADGRYEIPDFVSAINEESCRLDFQTETITGEKSYKRSIETSVGVEGGVYGVTFSASVDYKNVKQNTEKNSDIYLITQGNCKVYSMSLTNTALPKISSIFEMSIMNLPAEYDQESYFEIIKAFGTHYFTSMKMGARFGIQSRISKSKWTELELNGIKVSAAATYSGLFTAGVKSSVNTEIEQSKAFERERTESSHISIGSRPPADGNAVTWANNCFQEPMPISYNVALVSRLLTKRNFQNDPNITTKKNEFRESSKRILQLFKGSR